MEVFSSKSWYMCSFLHINQNILFQKLPNLPHVNKVIVTSDVTRMGSLKSLGYHVIYCFLFLILQKFMTKVCTYQSAFTKLSFLQRFDQICSFFDSRPWFLVGYQRLTYSHKLWTWIFAKMWPKTIMNSQKIGRPLHKS